MRREGKKKARRDEGKGSRGGTRYFRHRSLSPSRNLLSPNRVSFQTLMAPTADLPPPRQASPFRLSRKPFIAPDRSRPRHRQGLSFDPRGAVPGAERRRNQTDAGHKKGTRGARLIPRPLIGAATRPSRRRRHPRSLPRAPPPSRGSARWQVGVGQTAEERRNCATGRGGGRRGCDVSGRPSFLGCLGWVFKSGSRLLPIPARLSSFCLFVLIFFLKKIFLYVKSYVLNR